MINLKIEEINVANLPSMLRENFTPKPFRPNLPQRGLQGAMLRMPPQDGPAATANIVQNFRDNPPQQSNILRGTPPTPTPAITRQNAPNALAIQEAQEAFNDRRATAMAQQRLEANRMEGTGLVGAPLAYFINKYKENNNLSSYYDEALSQITSEAELAQFDADIRRQNEQNIRTDEQNFEQFLNRQDRAEVVADRNLDFDREGNRITAANKREDELLEDANKREDDQLKASLENDATLLDNERADIQRIANDTRTWATLAETDESMDIYLTRYNELLSALPRLAQMAGVEEDMRNLSQVDRSAKAWGWFKRWTGGSGPMASMMPVFTIREPTQLIDEISASEALNKLGSLDVPLTPVSDADIALVMATGLSPSRTEKYNYNTAKKAIENLEIEMNDILSKQQSLNLGGRSSSSIRELNDDELQMLLRNPQNSGRPQGRTLEEE
jgi:hypothetical protein